MYAGMRLVVALLGVHWTPKRAPCESLHGKTDQAALQKVICMRVILNGGGYIGVPLEADVCRYLGCHLPAFIPGDAPKNASETL